MGIEHNEWMFRRATWSEIQVMNTKTAHELWVPRRFIGELSLVGEPVMIVGLLKELEYKAGTVCPHVRHVIEMPRAVNDFPRRYSASPEPERPAPVVGIRLETGVKSRMMLGAVAAGILACVGTMIIFRDGTMGSRATFNSAPRVDLPFTTHDDYDSIVSRLGQPAEDRWQSEYRRLWYPQQSMTLVLMGSSPGNAHYIGALNAESRVIHTVGNSAPLLLKLR